MGLFVFQWLLGKEKVMTTEATGRRFTPVNTQPDFPAMERRMLEWWRDQGIL
jgi:hypothetical protein